MRAKDVILQSARAAFARNAAMIEWSPAHVHGVDVTALVQLPHGRPLHYSLQVKILARSNADIAHGLIARSALLGRKAQEQSQAAIPLLVLGVPHLSGLDLGAADQLLGSLTAYRHVIVVSAQGGSAVRLPTLSVTTDQPDDTKTRAHRVAPIALESDVSQWTMKTLIAPLAARSDDWSAMPRMQITTGSALAKAARVSTTSAYGVIEELRKRGWAGGSRGHIEVTDLPAIVRWMIDHWKHTRPLRIPLQIIYGGRPKGSKDLLDRMRRHARIETPWAVGGWAACHLHGLSFIDRWEDRIPTIHVDGDLKHFEKAIDAVSTTDLRDADLVVQPVTMRRTILDGRIDLHGVPTVDAWQAALDVAGDPNRGIEQTESIAESLWRP